MTDINKKQFAKALRKLEKGRNTICDSLPEIQKTPALDKSDIEIISSIIDRLDNSIAKLKKSYDDKMEWYNG